MGYSSVPNDSSLGSVTSIWPIRTELSCVRGARARIFLLAMEASRSRMFSAPSNHVQAASNGGASTCLAAPSQTATFACVLTMLWNLSRAVVRQAATEQEKRHTAALSALLQTPACW